MLREFFNAMIFWFFF